MPPLRAVVVPPPRSRVSELPLLVSAGLVAILWWFALRQVAAAEPVPGLGSGAAIAFSLASQLAFSAAEAAVGCTAWGVQGVAVRWTRLAPRLFVVSSAEALALAIAGGGTWLADPWREWLAGARVHPDAVGTPLARAFASFGVLTLVRLAAAGAAHAEAARARYPRALAIVMALYLATRLALWWTYALLMGHSFES